MKSNYSLKIHFNHLLFDFIFLLLALVCCFNRDNPDYASYETVYFAVGTGNTLHLLYKVEPLFGLICYIFYKLGFSYFQFQFIFHFISLLIFRKVILDYAKKPCIVILCFAFFPFLVFCVQMRNAMGTVIIMYALRFLKEDSRMGTAKYMVSVAMATMIHDSCIIYLLLLIVRNKNFYKFFRIYVLGEIIFVYTMLPQIMRLIYQITGNRRFLVYNQSTPVPVIIRHTLPVITVFIILIYCSKNSNRGLEESDCFDKLLLKCSLMICSYIVFIKLNINFFRIIYFMIPLIIITITNYSVNGNKRRIKNDTYLLKSYGLIISVFYFVMLMSPIQEETYNNVTRAILPWLK